MKKIILICLILLPASIYVYLNHNASSIDLENDNASIPNPEFNLTEVTEGLFVHLGKHVLFDDAEHDDIANLGFIIGEKCIAVIDTGGSTKIAQTFKNSIQSVSDKPICYVINTHVHFDHVLGNAVFKSDNTEFVGHVNLYEAMPANKEFFLTEFKEDLGEFANDDGIISPTLLVEDSMELELGNRKLTLQAFSSAHSTTDLIVIDNSSQTAFLGDLLFVQRIPALDGSLKGWLKVLEQLKTENFSNVIPGHGAVVEWPNGMEAENNYLTHLLTHIREKLDNGAFMEEIVDEVGKDEKLNWLLHEQHHKRNVTKAFSELEWE